MAHNTKAELSKALIDLSQEVSLNKITVGDVAERCGVSRHTFYYHFTDLFDLIIWTFCHMTDRINFLNWKSVCLEVARNAIKNRSFAISVYHSEYKEAFMERIFYIAEEFFSIAFKKLYPGFKDIVYVSRMAAYAVSGTIKDWFENNLDDTYLKAIRGVEFLLSSPNIELIKRSN